MDDTVKSINILITELSSDKYGSAGINDIIKYRNRIAELKENYINIPNYLRQLDNLIRLDIEEKTKIIRYREVVIAVNNDLQKRCDLLSRI